MGYLHFFPEKRDFVRIKVLHGEDFREKLPGFYELGTESLQFGFYILFRESFFS